MSGRLLSPAACRLLYGHLAAAVRGNTPAREVIALLAADGDAPLPDRALLKRLAAAPAEAVAPADILASVPGAFAPETIAVIRHAEHTPRLAAVLDAMAGDCRRRQMLAERMNSVTALPAATFVTAAIAALLITTTGYPVYAEAYVSVGAPAPFSDAAIRALTVAVAGTALLAFGFIWSLASIAQRPGRAVNPALTRMALAMPAMRNHIRRELGARLCGWCITAGDDRALLKAVLAYLALDTPSMRQGLGTLAARLDEKTGLAAALDGLDFLPPTLPMALRLGDATRDPEGALAGAVILSEEQAARAVDRLGRALFFTLQFANALMVGTFVVSAYLPIIRFAAAV
jgi:type II secretory pathway component PulF